VSLDPLHEQIARIAFALPEAGQAALAGGGAMLALGLVDRPTQDVDLFTPDPAEVTRLTDALAVALRAEGAQVRVDRRGPGFTRLAVTVADGRLALGSTSAPRPSERHRPPPSDASRHGPSRSR